MLGLVFYFLLFSYNVVKLLKIKTKIFGPTELSRVRTWVSGSRVAGLNHFSMIVLALAVVFNFFIRK